MHELKYRLSLVSLLFLLTMTLSHITEARGKRTKEPSSPPTDHSFCLQSERGNKIRLTRGLNKARSPLADNVDGTNWTRFCECFDLKVYEYSERLKKDGRLKDFALRYEDDIDQLAVECAPKSVPEKVAVQVPTTHTADHNNDARFNKLIEGCVQSPKGYLTNLEIHLSGRSSPRAAKVKDLSPAKYCACYFNFMRGRLGDTVAMEQLGSAKPQFNLSASEASDEAFDKCAKDLIQF